MKNLVVTNLHRAHRVDGLVLIFVVCHVLGDRTSSVILMLNQPFFSISSCDFRGSRADMSFLPAVLIRTSDCEAASTSRLRCLLGLRLMYLRCAVLFKRNWVLH